MKTNAIIRIIIWSIVIVILMGILSSVLFGWNLNSRHTERTEIAHSLDADGETFTSMRTAEGSVSAAEIRNLSIEWVAGDITILTKENSDQIRFAEDSNPDSRYQMSYKISGDELKIQFSRESVKLSGISIDSDVKKDLLIEVPADWVCQELELDAAAANLKAQNLTIHELDFDGASGNCDFRNCVIGDLDMDCASADVTFTGELEALDFDSASASFSGFLTNTPRSIDVDGMSGSIDITLPKDCGYTVSIDGLSSSFSTESHNTEYRNGMHVYGDGSCRIQLDGMSCDLIIRIDSDS